MPRWLLFAMTIKVNESDAAIFLSSACVCARFLLVTSNANWMSSVGVSLMNLFNLARDVFLSMITIWAPHVRHQQRRSPMGSNDWHLLGVADLPLFHISQ